MDGFIKRSQRNKLWAHARNKTTENLLVGTLQQLDEEYDRECRHYLRNRHRIQRELVELRSLTEDFNFPISNDNGRAPGTKAIGWIEPSTGYKSLKESLENKHTENKSSLLQSSAVRKVGKSSQLKECNSGDNSPVFDESRNKLFVNADQFVDHRDTLGSDLPKNVNPLQISTHLHDSTWGTQTGESRSLTWHEVDKTIPRHGHVCKYKEGQKGNILCQHFPCQIPRTYHSLGYRRDDLIPWLREARDGTFTIQSTTNKPSTEIHRHIRPHKLTSLEYFATVPFNSLTDNIVPFNSLTDNPVPRWRKNSLKHKVQFQPMEGPIFIARPSDPILEQIRTGSLGEIQGKPSMTRKTVSAKLRGLKQLVVEMKYRNDLTKPADWAVNYGARLPTRVLLNPAFPV